jgi:site-specific recombinase XerD
VERWLIRLMSDDTRYRYRRYIERFIEWLGERGGELAELGPDGLVEFHKVSRDYEVLDAVQDYVRSLKGRESYKRLVYSALRSFFLHNRVPLPQDRSFVVDGDKPRVVGSLTVGEVKRVLDSCNECYRAIVPLHVPGWDGVW